VQYFFQANIRDCTHTLALVSVYSAPDATLLEASSNTLWVSTYQGNDALLVIDFKAILSVVAMVPFPGTPADVNPARYFAVDKIGLEVGYMGGIQEDILEE
jgi:hypothetical protein